MTKQMGTRLLIVYALGLLFALMHVASAEDTNIDVAPINLSKEPIQPLAPDLSLNQAKISLGSRLFNDVRFSANDSISCATCHNFDQGGTTHTPLSLPGVDGNSVPLNTPTVFGSSLNFAQFWDGRAATLEDQIDGPVEGPHEMGTSWPEVIRKISADPIYLRDFQFLYGTDPTEASTKDAIATFERWLISTDSLFDRYLRGEAIHVPLSVKQGYQLFKEIGCATCHEGPNVGGTMFKKMGLYGDYFKDRGNITEADYGRYNVTKNEADRYVFKVPSLRNILITPPYFHDGSIETLEEAVILMAKYQHNRTLSADETEQLVMFLKSLTGEFLGRLPRPPIKN
jgi:cytochrome c peroxidase